MSVAKDKKTGKWLCRVSYRSDGKYKTITRKGFDTKKEAILKEAQIKVNIKEGKNADSDPNEVLTFAKYFEDWVDTYKIDAGLSVGTENKYLYVVKLVKEHFKNKPLVSITRKDYQAFLNKRGENRGKDTVEKTHYYIKSAIQDALHDGLIDKDFTYRANLTYDNKEKQANEKYWNQDEFTKLINHLQEDISVNNMMILIAGLTGLRIGEVFGLSWSDFNFKKRTLTVKRGYDYANRLNFTDGKTFAAKRTIAITNDLAKIIQKYKLIYSIKYPEYLFLDQFNKPAVSYNGLNLFLKRKCAKLGIQTRTPHALRHTHASILISNDIDIHYVSKRLGHKSVIETLSVYSHLINEMEQLQSKKALTALEAMSAKALEIY